MGDLEPAQKSGSKFWAKRMEAWREEMLTLGALGFITALVSKLYGDLADKLIGQPWQAIWFLLPLVLAAVATSRFLVGRKDLRLSRPFLVFLSIYICFFTVAATTSFLDWSRDLRIFSRPAPRSWATPVSMGDWRYFLVSKKPLTASDIVVVTVEPLTGRSPKEGRLEMVRLISMASAMNAKGVAFDFYLDGELDIDPLLCSVIEKSKMPVLLGYGFSRLGSDIVPDLPPKSVGACIGDEDIGHLAGFLDADRVSRFIPLRFRNDETWPALSLRVAHALEGKDLRIPEEGLLRFVEPSTPLPTVTYKRLEGDARERRRLTGRFVMVGEDSEREWFETPFGKKLGVTIHAEAVHSLRYGHFIRQSPWWLSFLTILVACYLLTVYAAKAAPARKLVLFCLVASALVIGASAIAILAGPEWFDVVYPLTAIWLLLGLLLLFRRRLPGCTGLSAAL